MDTKAKQKLKENLTEVYATNASTARIDALLDDLIRVVEDPNEELDEVLFLADEFEGGSSSKETFERVLALVLESLHVNKVNAQRLFEFYRHCASPIVYNALTGAFFAHLKDEQKQVFSSRI